MTTTSGIEKRLHNRADTELKKLVEDAFSVLTNSINSVMPGKYGSWASIELAKRDEPGTASFDSIRNKLQKAVIDQLQQDYREHAVKEFIGKVDTLHEQIEEIRDEIAFDG